MAKGKVVMRNAAVQAVGETYFRVSLVGLVAAGILAIVAVSIGEGSKQGLFYAHAVGSKSNHRDAIHSHRYFVSCVCHGAIHAVSVQR